jgi:hypothetical protein
VGEATITPTKDGEGLQKQPDTGVVTPVEGTPSIFHLDSPIISKSRKVSQNQ